MATTAIAAPEIRARARLAKCPARGFAESVAPELRPFFFLPFMHSEDLADQELCIALYEKAGLGARPRQRRIDISREVGSNGERMKVALLELVGKGTRKPKKVELSQFTVPEPVGVSTEHCT